MLNERISITCDCCGLTITGEAYELENGDIVCESCAEEETFVCEECGRRYYNWDEHWVEDECICDDCFSYNTFTCEDCGRVFFNRNDYGDNSTHLCETCRDNNWFECDGCGELHNIDYRNYYNDCFYCDDCYDNASTPQYIHDYYYKPEPIFHGKSEDGRFFGVELEIAGSGEDDCYAEEFLEILNRSQVEEHAYIKHDGSLDEGMEIVSHPMTLEYHKNSVNWGEFMERAVKRGYRSHQTSCCGLHVHVSREAFGHTRQQVDYNVAKVLYFIELHWNEIFKFTRRTESNIVRWAAPYGYEKKADDILKKAKSDCNRYHSINLQNCHTVEFRMFRGTLKYNTFIATLQLVNKVIDVAISYSEESLSKLSWSDFVKDITEPELIQYLKEQRLYVNDYEESEEEM